MNLKFKFTIKKKTLFTGKELLKCGLASHFCESKNLSELESALVTCNSKKDVDNILTKFCPPTEAVLSLDKNRKQINHCFGGNSIEAIVDKLKVDNTEWSASTLKVIKKCK